MKQLFKTPSLNLWFERSQKLLCKIIGAKKNQSEKEKGNPHTFYTKSYKMHISSQKEAGQEGKWTAKN